MKSQEKWYFRNPNLQENEPDDCMDNYEVIEYIDKGGFGKVDKCARKKDDLKVAIKTIPKRNIQNKERKMIENELKNMYRIDHPNVIKLISHFEDQINIYLVTEFCEHGNLLSFLTNQGGRFDERVCVFLLRQIINAIDYLHSLKPPIIHRDIKPENILIANNHAIKLIDFGSSKAFEQSQVMNTMTGTPIYMPPEIVQVGQQSEKVDMWTLGVLIYEFLTGDTPFDDKKDLDHNNRIEQIQQNILRNDIYFPPDFPPLAKTLVLKLLNRRPEKRPNIKQIKEDPWLKQFPSDISELHLRSSFNKIKNTYKSADNANSLFMLKMREKSHIQFEKEKRDKKDELKEEIMKYSQEIAELKSKKNLQQQQITYLMEYIENNKEKICQKFQEKFHPRTVEKYNKEMEQFNEQKSLLQKIIQTKENQIMKQEISISNNLMEVEQKLQKKVLKLEQTNEAFEKNYLVISNLKQQINALEDQIEMLKKETNIDITQEEVLQQKEERRRASVQQTHELEKYQKDLLTQIRLFLSAGVLSTDVFSENEKQENIKQLELKNKLYKDYYIEKNKSNYLEQLQEIEKENESKLKNDNQKYIEQIQELYDEYQKELLGNEYGLLTQKEYENLLKEITLKQQIKESQEKIKKLILERQNIKIKL